MSVLQQSLLYWMLGTAVVFAVAMALARPPHRNLRKALERFVLACAWPVLLVFLICWLIVLAIYQLAKRAAGRK